jgi:hypothetical protein
MPEVADLPGVSSPPGLSSVIALLYRADWTRLSLAGQVRGSDDLVSPGMLLTEAVRVSGAVRVSDEAPEAPVMLRVAPGRRYRRDDGSLSAGSDGSRAWQAGDGSATGGSAPPYALLLCPSWLLTGYSLAVEERVTACGREAIRVTGIARRSGRAAPTAESRLPGQSSPGFWYDRAEALIDAELGILLRCELADEALESHRGTRLVEFTSLDLDPGTDDSVFAPPPGSTSWDATLAGPDPEAEQSALAFIATYVPELTSPAVKTTRAAGGLGGLGAVLRFPSRRLAARPRPEEPGEQVPDDGPFFGPASSASGAAGPDSGGPGSSGPGRVSEDVLALLHRSGTTAARFTASAHFWANGAGILAGIPEPARTNGLGAAGHLTDTPGREADTTTHHVSQVRIDGWNRYRIEPAAGMTGPSLKACNEDRYWEVRPDRVSVDSPRPAPPEVADFADASWLLGCELWGGLPVTVNGRAAYRLSVRGGQAQSELLTLGLPSVAAVDAETGRLLFLTCYGRGKPALRWELRDLVEAGPDSDDRAFEFTVPGGRRIVRVGTGDDRPGTSLRSWR